MRGGVFWLKDTAAAVNSPDDPTVSPHDALPISALEEQRVIARSQHLSQNEDVRYLGRLLGDVIRAYGGEELFHRTEYIRRASVDRHRGISGADAVDTGLDRLSLDDTLSFVRRFLLFSMVAHLAQDRHILASHPCPPLPL